MQSREVGGPHHSRVVHEFRDTELRLRTVSPCWDVLTEGLLDRVQKEVARYGNTTTEDEYVRVEDGAEARARLAEPVSKLFERVQGARITSGDELTDDRPRQFAVLATGLRESESHSPDVGDLAGHAQQSPSRAVLFDASASTTSTGQTLRYNPHVAEFASRAKPATEQ